MISFLLFYLLAINIITFFIYGVDKRKAQNHRWRISETTLIALALAGGFFGAFLGMHLWHHKTRKPGFYIGIPLISALWIALLVIVVL